MGRIYFQLGLFDQANKLQESAIQKLREMATQPLLLARTEAERADTLTDLGDLKAAQALADAARSKIDAQPNAALADRVEITHTQARRDVRTRFSTTQRYSNEELALVRQMRDADNGQLFHALMMSGWPVGGLRRRSGRGRGREALAVASRDAGPDDLNVAQARGNISNALMVKSRYAEARPLQEQALATEEKVLGADHPQTMGVRRDLALALYRLGYYAQSRTMMEQVIAAQRKKLGDQHPAVAGSEINLGNLLVDSGDADTAEQVLTESAAIFEKKYGREYQGTRMALRTLAAAHALQGKLDLAEKGLNEVKAQEVKLDLREKEGDETDDVNTGRREQGDPEAPVHGDEDGQGGAQHR